MVVFGSGGSNSAVAGWQWLFSKECATEQGSLNEPK
jgi:hypothetical protein